MRSSMIALSLVFVFAVGCSKKKPKKDLCPAAKAELVDKLEEAVKAWTQVEKGWNDPELAKTVQKTLDKKAQSAGLEAAKAKADSMSFQGYLTFKKDHAKRSLAAVQKALAAAKGEDIKKARGITVRSLIVSTDKSGIRSRSASWFSHPNVVAVDEQQRKAFNLVTEARDLAKAAAKKCGK
ncbi:MAG: hypothetical protein ABI333_02650 [bacterium]